MARKRQALKRFTATGRLTLSGVLFTIEAADIEEAKAMAEAGEWIDFDPQSGDAVDWSINPGSVKAEE